MPRDLDALAEQVVLLVKAALAPVQAELAAVKAHVVGLDALRERVTVVETKAAQPIAPPEPPVPPDLTPVFERLAAAEARMAVLGDVRDRVVAVEAKALQPLSSEAGMDDVRDRLKTLETRAEGPSPTDLGLVDVRERLANVERRVHDDPLARELGTLRERVAVVEVRPALPGPPGEPGPSGRDGVDGKDGAPGLAFAGVYQEGKTYDVGELATWAGSSWHCNELTTTKPGDGSKAWTLMVKRGRDGKDGRDALGALPVVSIGRPT